MAVTGNSSAERTTRWDVLVSNLKSSLTDMPYVADDLKQLEDMLTQARALETQQEDLRSQARKANGQLKKMLRDGDKVRARLGSNLKGKFGFSDETLIKYGFKPRPDIVRRRKTAPAPTPAPQPTPTPAPGTQHTTPAKE